MHDVTITIAKYFKLRDDCRLKRIQRSNNTIWERNSKFEPHYSRKNCILCLVYPRSENVRYSRIKRRACSNVFIFAYAGCKS